MVVETPQKSRYSTSVVSDAQVPPDSPTRYESASVRKHPMVMLTGLWLILLVLGWLSISEIVSPGADTPMPKTPIAQTEQEQSSSFGVLGAIAGSCAVLSLLLSHKLDRN